MMKPLALLAIILFSFIDSSAQLNRYVVYFKNKGGTPYTFNTPSAYLSSRAIARRTRYSIAIDSTDLPVTPSFVDQVRNTPTVTLLNVSKWLNAISIHTTDANAISTISAMPFVKNVVAVAQRPVTTGNKFNEPEIPSPETASRITADYFNYGTNSFNEIHLHNGEFLHNIGLRGQGMHIAMLDGGFFKYNELKAFDSANLNGQILSTWDFVNREASVNEDNSHGMQCLSTIVANIPGVFVGKAPKASFHLFRTEDVSTEYRIEEFNWACGAERADSSGADVISTSVGYSIAFSEPSMNHPYSDMDGNTTMAAIAGDIAAKKGLLVFSSIGNDGDRLTENYLSTPSDGDSVVAVGAVNAAGVLGTFTSFGPSADGQVKPDVASMGVGAQIQFANNTVGTSNGTSWASPNMAGLTSCLWQGFPEYNNMKIVRTLQRSGNRSSNPDNRTGYGVPNVKLAFKELLIEFATATATVSNCTVTLNWTTKDVSAMKYEIERKDPSLSYVKVGELNPQSGSLLATRSYTFNNNLAGGSSGTYSYRIRQIIDTSGAGFTDAYIDTVVVNIANACIPTSTGNPNLPVRAVYLQPNPARGSSAQLVVESPYAIPEMKIIVIDVIGRRLLSMDASKGIGKTIIDLPIHKLANGKYFIQVYNGNKPEGRTEMIRL